MKVTACHGYWVSAVVALVLRRGDFEVESGICIIRGRAATSSVQARIEAATLEGLQCDPDQSSLWFNKT